LIVTGTFESLAYYVSFMINLFSALAVLALFKFRKGAGWKRVPWVSFAYPLIPLLYVGVNLLIFGYFVSNRVEEAIWASLTIVAGAIAYRLYIKTRPVGA